jgi:hypothetical protein
MTALSAEVLRVVRTSTLAMAIKFRLDIPCAPGFATIGRYSLAFARSRLPLTSRQSTAFVRDQASADTFLRQVGYDPAA